MEAVVVCAEGPSALHLQGLRGHRGRGDPARPGLEPRTPYRGQHLWFLKKSFYSSIKTGGGIQSTKVFCPLLNQT